MQLSFVNLCMLKIANQTSIKQISYCCHQTLAYSKASKLAVSLQTRKMAFSLRTVLVLSLGLSLLFTTALAGAGLIKETCKFAHVHRNMCFQVLASKRESRNANVYGLARIALQIVHKNASKLANDLVELHDKAEDMSDLQQCLEECLRQYEDAMEQLDDATAALDAKKYREAAQWVSVAQGDVRLCQVGCKPVPEYKNMLTKQNGNVGRLCSISASILRSLVAKKH